MVKFYSLFIEDDRYSAPTLCFLAASSDAKARDLALDRLKDSPHHLAVELRRDDDLIAELRNA